MKSKIKNGSRPQNPYQIFLLSGTLALLAILMVAPTSLHAQSSDYVEVFYGDMPLMFSVGHGGWKTVGDLKNSSADFESDMLLRDYFYKVLAVRIYEKTGHLPYIVYQQGKRNYVNTNRPVGDEKAYHPNNTEARDAYLEFHNQVDKVMARIETRYGADMALLINPHSGDLAASVGNSPWDRMAEIGFIAPVTSLNWDANTMRALYVRKGEVALRGEDSIPYQLFHAQDWPTPDAVWPAAATINSKTLARTGDDVWHALPAWVTGYDTDNWVTAYANGAWNVIYHGTNTWGRYADWPNGLDAFQIEINYTKDAGLALNEPGRYQLDLPFTTAFMDDFVDAILHSLQVNYNWTPGGVYNVVVDNGDAGFSTTGSWAESSGQGSWGTPSMSTNEYGATAIWKPDLAQSGAYQILIRWTKVGSRTENAQYTINCADGSRTRTINQSGDKDAKWVSLGLFQFDAGNSGSVVLECTDTDKSTAADATIFRLVDIDESFLPILLKSG